MHLQGGKVRARIGEQTDRSKQETKQETLRYRLRFAPWQMMFLNITSYSHFKFINDH